MPCPMNPLWPRVIQHRANGTSQLSPILLRLCMRRIEKSVHALAAVLDSPERHQSHAPRVHLHRVRLSRSLEFHCCLGLKLSLGWVKPGTINPFFPPVPSLASGAFLLLNHVSGSVNQVQSVNADGKILCKVGMRHYYL